MNKKRRILYTCLLTWLALPFPAKSADTGPEKYSAEWFRLKYQQEKISGIKSTTSETEVCNEARISEELKALANPRPESRRFAAKDLEEFCEQLGPRSQTVISALRNQLNDEYDLARQAAAITLAKFDFEHSKYLIKPVLFEAVKKDSLYAVHCIPILEKYGSDAGDLVPELIKSVKKESSIFIIRKDMMRYSLPIKLLKSIGTPEALRFVKSVKRMEDFRYSLRSPSVQTGIIVLFILLFVVSFILRKRKYKELVCRPLLIPVAVYIWRLIEEGMFMSVADTIEYNQIDEWTLFWLNNNVNQILFVATISAALLPWFVSWLLLWRRRRKQALG